MTDEHRHEDMRDAHLGGALGDDRTGRGTDRDELSRDAMAQRLRQAFSDTGEHLRVSVPPVSKAIGGSRRSRRSWKTVVAGIFGCALAAAGPVAVVGALSGQPPRHQALPPTSTTSTPTSTPSSTTSSSTPDSSSSTTSSSTTPSTGQATTPTAPAQQVLAPATVPPVVGECSQAVRHDADGNVSPLLCSDGSVNVRAWNWYASVAPEVLALGPNADGSQIVTAMCTGLTQHGGTGPIEYDAATLATAYYGWSPLPSAFVPSESCTPPAGTVPDTGAGSVPDTAPPGTQASVPPSDSTPNSSPAAGTPAGQTSAP